MDDYIVTVEYGTVFKQTRKFRVEAINELDAKRKILMHPYLPNGSQIVKARKAAYKKIKPQK